MEEKNKINIELTPEMAKGSYSNLSIITHSANEFIVDFIALLPGLPKAQVVSRIILNPENAKRLSKALQDNIGKYEDKFGEIELNNEQQPIFPMGISSDKKS